MSNINSNDDDIFEDYVDTSSNSPSFSDPASDTSINKVFSEVDSPFKSMLNNSSLKVGFTEAFYMAAHEWINVGYREANNAAIVDELVRITNGEFLYRQRIKFSMETISRKKTIVRFLTILLDETNTSEIISVASRDFNLNFNEKFFIMFFRSLYNIQIHSLLEEIVLYKSLCHLTSTPVDEDLCDLTKDSEPISNNSDYINKLYLDYFQKDTKQLEELREHYINEVFPKKDN